MARLKAGGIPILSSYIPPMRSILDILPLRLVFLLLLHRLSCARSRSPHGTVYLGPFSFLTRLFSSAVDFTRRSARRCVSSTSYRVPRRKSPPLRSSELSFSLRRFPQSQLFPTLFRFIAVMHHKRRSTKRVRVSLSPLSYLFLVVARRELSVDTALTRPEHS